MIILIFTVYTELYYDACLHLLVWLSSTTTPLGGGASIFQGRNLCIEDVQWFVFVLHSHCLLILPLFALFISLGAMVAWGQNLAFSFDSWQSLRNDSATVF